jgi:flavin-dependent thymidylate synthase
MGLISKIKNLFSKKDYSFDKKSKELEKSDYNVSNCNLNLISASESSNIDSIAARLCIAAKPFTDYNKIVDHIGRIAKRGHESIMGHSNIIMLLNIDIDLIDNFVDVSNAFHFLEYSVVKNEETSEYVFLIGGSIRAYKYFLRNIKDINNSLFVAVINNLYISAESVYFKDLIADGIMDENMFSYIPNAIININKEEGEDAEANGTIVYQEPTLGKCVDIIYSEDPYEILDQVKMYGFELKDVLKVTVCSIIFHDVSRAISQQMTRHLAGISQESQRYVNYSNCGFIDPTKFEDDKTDSLKLFTINIFGTTVQMTPQQLGDELIKIYPQLIDQGMLKQDARGFLPFNVPTKLMMTFTYSNLIHFIKERTNIAAQPEIRNISLELIDQLGINKNSTTLFTLNKLDDLINIVETPVYKFEKFNEKPLDIDDIISEEEIK